MTPLQVKKDFERITLVLHHLKMVKIFSYTNAKHKACILNNQFQSVFTTEDLSNVPQLDYSVYPSIQDLIFLPMVSNYY